MTSNHVDQFLFFCHKSCLQEQILTFQLSRTVKSSMAQFHSSVYWINFSPKAINVVSFRSSVRESVEVTLQCQCVRIVPGLRCMVI
jgi:hypothetical protein